MNSLFCSPSSCSRTSERAPHSSSVSEILFSARVCSNRRVGSSSGEKKCLSGVNELGIVNLFFEDCDESMSVDDVKTLPDVEFQKPAGDSPLFFDLS